MKKELTFEDALNKLEDTVKKLEGGNMSLDDSLASFEEAVALVKICNQKLEKAERRVRILIDEGDSVTDTSFDATEDEA